MVSQSMFALAGFLRDLRFPPAFKIGTLYCMLCWCLDPFGNKSHGFKGYPCVCLNKVIIIIIIIITPLPLHFSTPPYFHPASNPHTNPTAQRMLTANHTRGTPSGWPSESSRTAPVPRRRKEISRAPRCSTNSRLARHRSRWRLRWIKRWVSISQFDNSDYGTLWDGRGISLCTTQWGYPLWSCEAVTFPTIANYQIDFITRMHLTSLCRVRWV